MSVETLLLGCISIKVLIETVYVCVVLIVLACIRLVLQNN